MAIYLDTLLHALLRILFLEKMYNVFMPKMYSILSFYYQEIIFQKIFRMRIG